VSRFVKKELWMSKHQKLGHQNGEKHLTELINLVAFVS